MLDGIFRIASDKFLRFQNYSLVLVLDILEERGLLAVFAGKQMFIGRQAK